MASNTNNAELMSVEELNKLIHNQVTGDVDLMVTGAGGDAQTEGEGSQTGKSEIPITSDVVLDVPSGDGIVESEVPIRVSVPVDVAVEVPEGDSLIVGAGGVEEVVPERESEVKSTEVVDETTAAVESTEVVEDVMPLASVPVQGGTEEPMGAAIDELKKLADVAALVQPSEGGTVVLSSAEEDSSCKTPVKKRKAPASRRKQPARSGKVQRTLSPRTKVKKGSETLAVQMGEKPKTVLEEFNLDKNFFEEHQLKEVYDLISFQGWEHLLEEEDEVDKDLVLEFYQNVSKVEKGSNVYLQIEFRGETFTVSSRDLALELGLPHGGFDTFTKRQWPEYVTEAEKEEMATRVCNVYEPNVNDLTTLNMDPKVKILHRFLVSTILPRGSKTAVAQIEDILVLDQMLRRQKVNLPKLIIHQMEYVSSLQYVGHARIVKKILRFLDLYKPVSEESVVKPLTMHMIHRWGILLDEDKGWVRKAVEAVVEKTEEPGAAPSDMTDRLVKIESDIRDIKLGLAELKNEVTKVADSQWIIEEDIREMKVMMEKAYGKRKA